MARTTVSVVAGDKAVRFGAGIVVPLPLAWKTEGMGPFDLEGEAMFEDGRFVVEWVTVKRRKGGPPVTNEQLRLVPIAEGLRTGLLRAVDIQAWFSQLGGPTGSDVFKAGPANDEALHHVAAMYRLARACGEPATERVAAYLGCSRATAGRWIQKARARGILGPSAGTKAGERNTTKKTGKRKRGKS
ncbi:MAG TPA: hypothetical protein VF711_03740 [Acidimicrobiales bacterium]